MKLLSREYFRAWPTYTHHPDTHHHLAWFEDGHGFRRRRFIIHTHPEGRLDHHQHTQVRFAGGLTLHAKVKA